MIGHTIGIASRKACWAKGLKTIGYWEAVNLGQGEVLNEDDEGHELVVMRVYSPKGEKCVEVTRGDLFYYSTVYVDSPMARVRPK